MRVGLRVLVKAALAARATFFNKALGCKTGHYDTDLEMHHCANIIHNQEFYKHCGNSNTHEHVLNRSCQALDATLPVKDFSGFENGVWRPQKNWQRSLLTFSISFPVPLFLLSLSVSSRSLLHSPRPCQVLPLHLSCLPACTAPLFVSFAFLSFLCLPSPSYLPALPTAGVFTVWSVLALAAAVVLLLLSDPSSSAVSGSDIPAFFSSSALPTSAFSVDSLFTSQSVSFVRSGTSPRPSCPDLDLESSQ